MRLRNLGKWLVIGIFGLGLSTAQAAGRPAMGGGFRGGFHGGFHGFSGRAIPSRPGGIGGFHSFRGMDRGDHFGRGFDRGPRFRDRDFGLGLGLGFGYGYYNPWWGSGWGWGYGWPYWGPYPDYNFYYAPGTPTGKVKIETPIKDAQVYVDGGYVGTVHERHQFSLDTGVHKLEVRAPNGETFDQRIDVLKGQTLVVHPVFEPPAEASR